MNDDQKAVITQITFLFILDVTLNGYTEEKRLKTKDMIEKILSGGKQ